jgi:hypothetical protein
MVKDLLWRSFAWFVSLPAVADWLIRRAQRTPYAHITSPTTGELYMGRWWLFNPYQPHNDGAGRRWAEWMPSIRIHHIIRPDSDRHLHSHPWNARTVILKGGYREERYVSDNRFARAEYLRQPGYTGTLSFGEYHRISQVASAGAWTLFITWKKLGSWYFDVDGVKVNWRKYLGIQA